MEFLKMLFPFPWETVTETEPEEAIKFLEIRERGKVKFEQEPFLRLVPDPDYTRGQGGITVIPKARFISFPGTVWPSNSAYTLLYG